MRAGFILPKVLVFALVACGDTTVETNDPSDASAPDAAGDATNCMCHTDADCGVDGFCVSVSPTECYCEYA